MNQTSTITRTASRNPLDALIDAVAVRIGGSKAKEVERFLRFAVVGTIGAIIDFSVLFLLQATILPPTLKTPDWNVAIAQTISFSLATISNYILNRYWTYPDSRSRAWHKQMIQFAAIGIVGWIFRTIWITSIHNVLGHALMPLALPFIQLIHHSYVPSASGEAKLGTMVAWFIGVVVVMVWNFIVNRLWTYSDVQ